MSSIFSRAMGENFSLLHPMLQKRFGVGLEEGYACVGAGTMHRIRRGPWWTVPFLQLGRLRNILVPDHGTDIPFRIENYPYRDRLGRETVTFVREYRIDGRMRRFDATMILGRRSGRIVDYLGTHQHLAVDLEVHAEPDGSLLLRSDAQRFYEGPVAFRFPMLFSGRAELWESYDDETGEYRVALEVRNRVFGFLFGYDGTFTCEFPDALDAPERLKPRRTEPREQQSRHYRGRVTHTLNDGSVLPDIGFGTYPLRGEEGTAAMVSALEVGYRYLDSAVNYENEREVGEALRRSGLPRDQVQLATKIPGRFHEEELALRSLADSAERLGVERIDVALIHWPNPSRDLYPQAWRALVRAQRDGLVRTIGVSNFTAAQLQRIVDDSGVTPAINQLELHPQFSQHEMRQTDADRGILTQAWSPLGKRSAPFRESAVADAAERHGVSPAQVVLRWHVQLGTMPLPKSATPERQRANLDVHGFELDDAELAAIGGLARADGRLFGGDPDTHEEM